jgi:hypothetical protein
MGHPRQVQVASEDVERIWPVLQGSACQVGSQRLLASLLAGSFSLVAAQAQAEPQQTPTPTVAAVAPVDAAIKAASPRDWAARNSLYFKRNWGLEIVGVKPVSSGYMLSFKYRVVDADKARQLNDRKTRAFLRDEASGTVLSVPAMENVGELRTGAVPEEGRTYFMIFGNPGKLVKSGSRVSVVAGALHVDNLIVD